MTEQECSLKNMESQIYSLFQVGYLREQSAQLLPGAVVKVGFQDNPEGST